jgi:hypothetical protein
MEEAIMSNIEDIRKCMEIIGADGVHLGTVDAVEERRIKMTRPDSGAGSHEGHHHYFSVGLIAAIEGNKVRLSANSDVVQLFREEEDPTVPL